MIVKNDIDTIVNLYRSLSHRIIFHVKHYEQKFKPLDPVVASILKGNACTIEEDAVEVVDEIEDDKLCIYYIKHAMGNEENLFMDVIHIYGLTHVVVFLDFFNKILDYFPDIPDDPFTLSVDEIATINLGNSNYFTALQQIATVVCDIIKPLQTSNTSFAMCDNFRKVPSLIAGHIIDFFRDFDFDTDASSVPMDKDEFMYWVSKNNVTEAQFQARLLGVKD